MPRGGRGIRDESIHEMIMEYDCIDDEREETCQYCKGRGYLTVDSGGAGPAYACPDCSSGDEEDEDE